MLAKGIGRLHCATACVGHNRSMTFTRTRLIWMAVVLIGMAVLLWSALRGQAVEVVVVTQGPMVQSVVTAGRIVMVARNDIAAQSSARIDAILVREGDQVQANQVLVRLRDDEAVANLAQSRAAVAEARARIRQIATVQEPVSAQQLKQAIAADAQAAQELTRSQDLVKKGFISQSRLDDAQRAALSSAAAVLAARAQAQGNQGGGAEAAVAQTRLEQAMAAEKAAATRLDQLSLRAPVAATVIARAADPGDMAQPGRSILTLVSGDETRIAASVDEKNLQYVKLGQAARATADAYPDRTLAATLTYIAPAVDAQRGTVDLKLRVNKSPDFLRPDMTVSVEIITAQEPKAVKLPTDAVRRDANGASFVLVNRDGRAQRLVVTTGLRGIGTTQIVKGLVAGDRVILPTASVEEGARVRERAEHTLPSGAQPAATAKP